MAVGMRRAHRTGLGLWILALGLLAGPRSLLSQQAAQTPALSERELAGKKLFLQRCSLCHLPPLMSLMIVHTQAGSWSQHPR